MAETQQRYDDAIPEGAVVVGIGDSVHDQACVEWAVGAATRLGRPLHIVRARNTARDLSYADPTAFGAGLPITIDDIGRSQALETAVASARELAPDLAVSASEPLASPEVALIDASESAEIIVVGAARVGAIERALLGRPTLAAAMHAACPVVIFPEGARTGAEGPVVVGLDGSDHSRRAAEQAFWVAQLRGADLVAVTTWSLEIVNGFVVTTPKTAAWDQVEAKYHRMLAEIIDPLREQYPDVAVRLEVRRGSPSEVLTEESREAGLLVVGSRGRGGFRGMLLGSVSQAVLEHATCPVLIVRHERT